MAPVSGPGSERCEADSGRLVMIGCMSRRIGPADAAGDRTAMRPFTAPKTIANDALKAM